jgi:hypothetical protein
MKPGRFGFRRLRGGGLLGSSAIERSRDPNKVLVVAGRPTFLEEDIILQLHFSFASCELACHSLSVHFLFSSTSRPSNPSSSPTLRTRFSAALLCICPFRRLFPLVVWRENQKWTLLPLQSLFLHRSPKTAAVRAAARLNLQPPPRRLPRPRGLTNRKAIRLRQVRPCGWGLPLPLPPFF